MRWWEHWLKGADTGIMDEPQVRAFMPFAPATSPRAAEAGGRWIAEAKWPPRTDDTALFLGEGVLHDDPQPTARVTIAGDQLVGLTRTQWLDRPPQEQSRDDDRSVTFDSAVLTDDVEILGAPSVDLLLSADRPVAMLGLRL